MDYTGFDKFLNGVEKKLVRNTVKYSKKSNRETVNVIKQLGGSVRYK